MILVFIFKYILKTFTRFLLKIGMADINQIKKEEITEIIDFGKIPVFTQNDKTIEGKVVSLPTRQEIDFVGEEHLIVEYYSK